MSLSFLSFLRKDETYWGWTQALFNILILWGISHVCISFSARILDVNTILFACISFASSALLLLLVSGPGQFSSETLKSVATWGYGVILLITYICVFLLFSRVTATEGSIFLMFGMNVSLLASWFFFARQPTKEQIAGNILVFLGVLLAAYDTAHDKQFSVYLLVFVLGIIATARVFLAETHKPYTQAANSSDPKARARVVAFIMFIVSLIFTVVVLGIAALKHQYSVETSGFLDGFPTLGDFMNPATVFAGLIYGAILMAPLRFLEFSSTSRIKGENYLTVTALSPLATLFWEFATDGLTHLNLDTISAYHLWACALITGGAFWAAYSQIKRHHHRESWQDMLCSATQAPDMADDSHELVANALEHFNGHIQQAATSLGVAPMVIEAFIDDTDKTLTFKPEVYRHIARQFRKNVATGDILTGLSNRAGLLKELKLALSEPEPLNLLYIDLDKFKPVNDTYGHQAGDQILKDVAKRLQKLFPTQSTIARLGGDEFCVLLLGCSPKSGMAKVGAIQKALQKPFVYAGKKIEIGASVGQASYPQDSTDAEELIKLADQSMYHGKKASIR